jgi:hypothetical protein
MPPRLRCFNSKAIERLRQVEGRVEIRDEAGQLIGYFVPSDDRGLEGLPYQDVEVPFTDEELDRFEQELGGYTLDEILTNLEGSKS